MLRVLLLCFFITLNFGIQAQSVTGSWYGNANVVLEGRHNSYLTELIIQQKGDEVVGIFGYYFKNGYESVYVRGSYNKKDRTVTINNIPITYFRAKNIDGVDCFMDFTGQLMTSRIETNLNGYFMTNARYKYTCPELRVLYDKDTTENNLQDSLIRFNVAKKIWKPLPDDIIVAAKPDKDTIAATTILTTPFTDSAAKPTPTVSVTPPPAAAAIAAFEARKNVISNEIVVYSDSVRVSFYDNGDIDGDTISVFLNKQPILLKEGITAKALNIYIHLDPALELNELSMFADNLGKFPPNTALMVINDGINRQEVYLSSSLSQNATVRIRRKR